MKVLQHRTPFFCCLGVLFCLALTGCTTVGTKILSLDRNRYSSELSKGEKSQMLLNIVRIRYLDTISFLQVDTITAQKTIGGSGGADVALFNPYRALSIGTTINPSVNYSDAPTVAFTPMQGATFVRHMLTMVPLKSIFYVTNMSWNIDTILRLSVERINNFHNQNGVIARETNRTPFGYQNFLKVLHYLRVLQQHDALELFLHMENGEQQLIIKFHYSKAKAAELALKRLLKVPADAKFLILTSDFHTKKQADNVVTVQTRSLMSMMAYLANSVQVPAKDRAVVMPFAFNPSPMFIHSCPTLPKGNTSFYTVFRNNYFYIDERDQISKRYFILLSIFYQLTAGISGGHNGTILTLPIGK